MAAAKVNETTALELVLVLVAIVAQLTVTGTAKKVHTAVVDQATTILQLTVFLVAVARA